MIQTKNINEISLHHGKLAVRVDCLVLERVTFSPLVFVGPFGVQHGKVGR